MIRYRRPGQVCKSFGMRHGSNSGWPKPSNPRVDPTRIANSTQQQNGNSSSVSSQVQLVGDTAGHPPRILQPHQGFAAKPQDQVVPTGARMEPTNSSQSLLFHRMPESESGNGASPSRSVDVIGTRSAQFPSDLQNGRYTESLACALVYLNVPDLLVEL